MTPLLLLLVLLLSGCATPQPQNMCFYDPYGLVPHWPFAVQDIVVQHCWTSALVGNQCLTCYTNVAGRVR